LSTVAAPVVRLALAGDPARERRSALFARRKDDHMNVLGFAGSLRRGSYNRALLRSAVELAPTGLTIDVFDLRPLPLFDADLDDDASRPAPVEEFKRRIREADALLIATPEYNYSTSGVLKNAIDWASRPARGSPLDRKPVALMGASGGDTGTARAQLALRQSFVFTNTWPLNKPEVRVSRAATRFDGDLRLTDETTRQFVRELLEALVEWTQRLRGGGA
jgi:chromate reductase